MQSQHCPLLPCLVPGQLGSRGQSHCDSSARQDLGGRPWPQRGSQGRAPGQRDFGALHLAPAASNPKPAVGTLACMLVRGWRSAGARLKLNLPRA